MRSSLFDLQQQHTVGAGGDTVASSSLDNTITQSTVGGGGPQMMTLDELERLQKNAAMPVTSGNV